VSGPGGMFVLSLDGNLYRVSEAMSGAMHIAAQLAEVSTVPEPTAIAALACAAVAWSLKRPRRRSA